MVYGRGLLLGSGVRAMNRELEQFLNVEVEWVMDRLINSPFDTADRNYYQGRLDQLAQVRRYLGHPQIMRERASK
jgi:hypothetical protein